MKLFKNLIKIVLILLIGNFTTDAFAQTQSDSAAIMHQFDRWMEAARQENADDLSKIYAENAIMLPPNAPQIKGRSEIRTLFGKQFAGSDATFEFQTHELLVAGDWAYRWGSYEVSITLENGNPVKQKDKFIEIWWKNSEEEWLIARDIWNRTSTSNGN